MPTGLGVSILLGEDEDGVGKDRTLACAAGAVLGVDHGRAKG
jgi:hypothetical protein